MNRYTHFNTNLPFLNFLSTESYNTLHIKVNAVNEKLTNYRKLYRIFQRNEVM